jgi:hypothetical protein
VVDAGLALVEKAAARSIFLSIQINRGMTTKDRGKGM